MAAVLTINDGWYPLDLVGLLGGHRCVARFWFSGHPFSLQLYCGHLNILVFSTLSTEMSCLGSEGLAAFTIPNVTSCYNNCTLLRRTPHWIPWGWLPDKHFSLKWLVLRLPHHSVNKGFHKLPDLQGKITSLPQLVHFYYVIQNVGQSGGAVRD